MKVLAVHNFYQHPGGEDRVFALEQELLASHGHDVIQLTAHNNALRRVSAPAVLGKTIWSADTYRQMREILRRERPAVVHVHNTLPLISPAVYWAAARAGVPVIQTLHNYRLLCPSSVLLRDQAVCEDCLGRWLAWPAVVHGCYRESRTASAAVAAMVAAHRLIGTWSTRITKYIALTEFMRRKFIEAGFAAEQLVVKPNFVAPDPGPGGHRGQYALFVGRICREKGVLTLVRAWERVGPGLTLKIAGQGPLSDLGQVARPGIEWLGHQSHDEVLALMKDARMLVFPAEWYEGFPLTIAEAFATGLPVLASRIGAMAELVDDRRTGLLFTPGDPAALAEAVQWAQERPDHMAVMGRLAREEYLLKYTAERNYRLLYEIYAHAVATQRCAAKQRHQHVGSG
jgi:glycosyltransferase involved in cell wall biosynthesis